MTRRRWLLAGAGVCMGMGLFAALRPAAPVYPSDDAGWSARWDAAAAGIGLAPGDGWDRWTDAVARAAGLTRADPALTPDQLRTRLAAIDWPERVTPPSTGATIADEPDWTQIFEALAGGIDRAASDSDADNAVGWARLAHRIERGVGAHEGYAGSVRRCGLGTITDRAVRGAAGGGLFSPGPVPSDADENRLGDLIALCIEGGPFGAELATRLERERAVRAALSTNLPRADLRRIEVLFYDLEESHRGRTAGAGRLRATLDALARGRHPSMASVLPDIDAATDARRAARAERVGLQMMLSLERHRLRNGAYPQSLEELVPDQFIHVPVDPYGFGERFGYRVLDPLASTPADGYLLYSVGPDRTPDAGRPLDADARGDLILNPPVFSTEPNP